MGFAAPLLCSDGANGLPGCLRALRQVQVSGVFSVQYFVPPAPGFPSVCPSVSSFFVPSSSSSVFGSTSFHPPFRCPALVSVLALSAVTLPFSAPVSLSSISSPSVFFFFFFF